MIRQTSIKLLAALGLAASGGQALAERVPEQDAMATVGAIFIADCEVVKPAYFYSSLLVVGNCDINQLIRSGRSSNEIDLPTQFSVLGARAEAGFGQLVTGERIALKLEVYTQQVYVDFYNTKPAPGYSLAR